ncbi:MAG: DUF1697 domain-containing protein [Cytophagales bacterium]
MATYISILRGINVSGQKLIKMDDLKKVYENLNLVDIQTYLQSGNVIFSTKESDLRNLETKIKTQIEKDFGFEVPIIVLNIETLADIIKHNPFANDNRHDISCLHVTFLAEQPKEIDKKSIEVKKQEGEKIEFAQNAIYLYCPNGYGKTKLHNTFLESKLKVNATTRNWKTVNELLKLVTK